MKSDKYHIFSVSIIELPESYTQSNQVIVIIGVYTDKNKLAIITVRKTFYFNFSKDVDKSWKDKIIKLL